MTADLTPQHIQALEFVAEHSPATLAPSHIAYAHAMQLVGYLCEHGFARCVLVDQSAVPMYVPTRAGLDALGITVQ